MTDWKAGSDAIAILSFDVDAESPVLAHSREYADHAMVMTHQAFGPLVGVPRILQLLADYDLPATFFIPGLTADRYPAMVESVLAAGHEVGHHSYSHHSAVDLDADGERRDFERALEALAKHGVRPTGHRAAMWEATWRTPSLVAEYGLEYDSSLMDADRPYVLDTPEGPIVELPPFWGLDDWEQYAFLPRPNLGSIIQSPVTVAGMWTHEVQAMRKHGSLFLLTCHPFLSGRAGRIEALRTVIEHTLDAGGVEFSRCVDIARRAKADATLDRRTLTPVVVSPEIYPN